MKAPKEKIQEVKNHLRRRPRCQGFTHVSMINPNITQCKNIANGELTGIPFCTDCINPKKTPDFKFYK